MYTARFPILLNQRTHIFRVRIFTNFVYKRENETVLENWITPRASLVAVRNRKPATRVAYPVSRKESLDLEVEGILVRSITVQCFGQTTKRREIARRN